MRGRLRGFRRETGLCWRLLERLGRMELWELRELQDRRVQWECKERPGQLELRARLARSG